MASFQIYCTEGRIWQIVVPVLLEGGGCIESIYDCNSVNCECGRRHLFPKAARLAKPERAFSHAPQHQPAYGSEGETERDLDSSPESILSFTQLVEDQGKAASSERQSHRQGEAIHGAGQGQLAVSCRQVT